MNRNQLKYLAALAMLLDHIAWAFVPTASLLGQGMHFAGRITAPIMAFFVAEGYHYTRNLKKYVLRMGLFALLSWAPFTYFNTGTLPIHTAGGMVSVTPAFGVVYTLLLGLLAICVVGRTKWPVWGKVLSVIALCLMSIPGDWPVFNVLWCLIFYSYRNQPKKKWGAYCLVGLAVCAQAFSADPWWSGLYSLGVFLPPLLLQCGYNGRPGARGGFHKWFFYGFYPAHLLILGIFRWMI